MTSPILLFLFLLIPIFAQDCLEPICLQSLNQTLFTKDDLDSEGWQFKNFTNGVNYTIQYLGYSYLGGADYGRIIFSKFFNITPSHYALTIDFTILAYEELDPKDRFLVYADGLRVYIFDPMQYEGAGPFYVNFSFSHQNPNVTIEFRSEDSNRDVMDQEEKPEELPKSRRLLVAFGRLLAEYDKYNIALNKPTNQSSTELDYNSSYAVDGNLDRSNTSLSIAKTQLTFAPEIPFFYVDLEHIRLIDSVRITLSENVTFANASKQYVLTIGNDSNITNNLICKDGLNLGSGTFTCDILGRYVGIYYKMLDVLSGQLEIAEIEIFQYFQNILIDSTVNQSSILDDNATQYGPENAIDNSTWPNPEDRFAAITKYELNPWWMANVSEPQLIKMIRISLTNNKTSDFLYKLNVTMGNSSNLEDHLNCALLSMAGEFLCDFVAKYIIIQVNGKGYYDSLELAEVEAYVYFPPPRTNSKNYAIRDLMIQIKSCDSRCENCVSPKLCTPRDIFTSEKAIVSLRDLNSFAAEVLSPKWTFFNISEKKFEYFCGQVVYLGGYGIFEGGSYFEETIDIPAFHYKLRVGFDLLVLDDFLSRNDEFIVFADDLEVFRYSPLVGLNERKEILNGYSYLCGREDKLDTEERLEFEFLHTNQSLKLKFLSNSTTAAVNASYGLRNLDIDFYQCYWSNGCFELSRRLDEKYLRNGRLY